MTHSKSSPAKKTSPDNKSTSGTVSRSSPRANKKTSMQENQENKNIIKKPPKVPKRGVSFTQAEID